jgi:hypothetical protein
MIHLRRSLIAGLQAPVVTLASVQESLQKAIELEHATIPPYLYALYSLDPNKNGAIASIIQSVVLEEMLHMTLSSNVLNALGGSPKIDQPGFIPTYPGPLPGGVESELKVNLAPFSTKQLATFLQIEEPETPLHFRAALVGTDVITIGEFYTAIADAIGALPAGSFVNPPRNQVGPDLLRDAVVVTDVPTARQAIQIIIDQGEGTKTSPEEVEGAGYAHYYRFMQIQKGHLLVPVPGATQPDQKYAYTGAAVRFDPAGVYAVPCNPGKPPGYPAGSPQAFANDNFNYTYTNLLGVLHGLFNGQATRDQFDRVIALMMSLKGQAKAMMSGIPNQAVLVGPSFQYQPVNPEP